jgi:hypothetical protein
MDLEETEVSNVCAREGQQQFDWPTNELAVRQSLAGKDVNTEADEWRIYIAGSHNLATASEDKLRKLSERCSERSSAWISESTIITLGAPSSVVGWGTMLQAGRLRVQVPIRWIFFQFTWSFQPHYGPGVDSASNKNEYQESSWGVNGCQRVRLTTLLPSVSWLSRENVWASTSHNPTGPHSLLQG